MAATSPESASASTNRKRARSTLGEFGKGEEWWPEADQSTTICRLKFERSHHSATLKLQGGDEPAAPFKRACTPNKFNLQTTAGSRDNSRLLNAAPRRAVANTHQASCAAIGKRARSGCGSLTR